MLKYKLETYVLEHRYRVQGVFTLVASDYTLLWHHARTQSVKAALENLNTQKSTSRRILTDALPKQIQNILKLGQIYALNFGVLDLYNKYRINISKILAKVTRHPKKIDR